MLKKYIEFNESLQVFERTENEYYAYEYGYNILSCIDILNDLYRDIPINYEDSKLICNHIINGFNKDYINLCLNPDVILEHVYEYFKIKGNNVYTP